MTVVIEERPADGVALLRINRPEARNALSLDVRRALAEAISRLDNDGETRAIVITGDDKAFAAGADVQELLVRKPHDRAFRDARVAWEAMEACRIPLIAAVNGFALGGGCELALHCDILIVCETATLGFPEVKLGIMPGAGGTQRALRLIGKSRAMRYILTGDTVTGAQAAAMGLASEAVPDAEVLPHALKVAGKIARHAPIAVASIKDVLIQGQDASLEAAIKLEARAFELLFATEDKNEGISAFLEKRKPSFRGA